MLQIIEGHVNSLLDKNKALADARRQICFHCYLYNSVYDSCNHCGCPIDKKGRVERAHCPIKKW